MKFTNEENELIQFWMKCEAESIQLYPMVPKIKAKIMSSNDTTSNPIGLDICRNQLMHLINSSQVFQQ